MARPRVILACGDPEVAVAVSGCLNSRRYRLEQTFDLSEALLRAKLVMAHAAIIYTEEPDETLVRCCEAHRTDRFSLVFVSPSEAIASVADGLGAEWVKHPFRGEAMRRAVFRAVAVAQDHRRESRHRRALPAALEAADKETVLLLSPDPAIGGILAAIISEQLKVSCEVADRASHVSRLLHSTVACVVSDPRLLMGDIDGLDLARRLIERGIPFVSMQDSHDLDVSSAAEVAWALIPQIRITLSSRGESPTSSWGSPKLPTI